MGLRGPKPGGKKGGRQKGTPNKATADVRAAVALLAQGNIAEVERWLQQGAKSDPLGAVRAFVQLLEYHIPKLSRTELSTGSDTLRIEIVDPTRRDNPPAQ